MNYRLFISILLAIGLVILIFIPPSSSKQGISDNEILLGQSCALSGPAQRLGREFRDGANAYFACVNENGGIHGRKIKLITLDDKYEPMHAVKNSQELIHKNKVFALFGEVGTPTSKAALRVAHKNKTPFLTPFTGAEFLRDNSESLVVNLRSSYLQETEAIVEYLTSVKKITKISIFYQNDSYGKAGYAGVQKALKKRSLLAVSEGRYRRNTLSYTNALQKIKISNPEAIILIGAYKPSAYFTKSAKEAGLTDTLFCNISFVGSEALLQTLDYDMNNIIISQVVPTPLNSSNESVKEYRKTYKVMYPDSDYSFVSLEGFLSAKLVVSAIRKSGENINRAKFISSFTKLSKSTLPDLDISFKENDNQALHKVYLTEYKEGKFVQITSEVKEDE